jgi:hypothetical protein
MANILFEGINEASGQKVKIGVTDTAILPANIAPKDPLASATGPLNYLLKANATGYATWVKEAVSRANTVTVSNGLNANTTYDDSNGGISAAITYANATAIAGSPIQVILDPGIFYLDNSAAPITLNPYTYIKGSVPGASIIYATDVTKTLLITQGNIIADVNIGYQKIPGLANIPDIAVPLVYTSYTSFPTILLSIGIERAGLSFHADLGGQFFFSNLSCIVSTVLAEKQFIFKATTYSKIIGANLIVSVPNVAPLLAAYTVGSGLGYAADINPIKQIALADSNSKFFVTGITANVKHQVGLTDQLLFKADDNSSLIITGGEVKDGYKAFEVGSVNSAIINVMATEISNFMSYHFTVNSVLGMINCTGIVDEVSLDPLSTGKLNGFFSDSTSKHLALYGDINYIYPNTEIVPLDDYLGSRLSTSLDTGGDISQIAVDTIRMSAGSAWFHDIDDGRWNATKHSWDQSDIVLALPVSGFLSYWVSITYFGVWIATTGGKPNTSENLVVGQVVVDSAGIRFIHDFALLSNNFPQQVESYAIIAHHKLLQSGLLATAGTTIKKVNIASGSWFIALHSATYGGTADSTFTPFWYQGNSESAAVNEVNITSYDNSTSYAITTATWLANVATITTSTPHRYISLDDVTIADVSVAGYNGVITDITVTGPTTFTYALLVDPGAPGVGGTVRLTGGLEAMQPAWHRADTLYLTSDGNLSLIYGTSEFLTQAEAEAEGLQAPPSFIEQSSISIANLIVKQGVGIVSILDARPALGGTALAAVGGITSHSGLTGLLSDDHPQYLLTNGNRALSGSLDMGTNSIINVGTVDGVDVSTHGARHAPGGTDPNPTALVGDIAAVNAANNAGNSNNYSRGNHVHAHGSHTVGANHSLSIAGNTPAGTNITSAGFMSGEDFINLRGSTTTGIIDGGIISVNVDTTKFDITLVRGWIVDPESTPTNPTRTYVVAGPFTAQIPAGSGIGPLTYVAVNAAGVLVQQTTPFTNAQRRTLIEIGRLGHSTPPYTTIIAATQQAYPSINIGNQHYDLAHALGSMNIDGNAYTSAGLLTLARSEGHVFLAGANWGNDKLDPSVVHIVAENPVSLRMRTRFGINGAPTTNVDTSNYDLAGVVTPIPAGKVTVHRIYSVIRNTTEVARVMYGQNIYNSISEAFTNVMLEPFIVDELANTAILRTFLIVRQGATNLADTATCLFVPLNKFGAATALTSVASSFQSVYDLDGAARIVESDSIGSIEFKQGGLATSKLLRVLDNTDAEIFSAAPTGNVYVRGLTIDTVTGVLKAAAGLVSGSATTLDLTENTNLYFREDRVIATPITGFISGAGIVTAADTVLSAFNKLDGNIAGKQPTGSYITALTGEVTAAGPGSVAATLSNAAVIGKTLTAFTRISSTTPITGADTILQAIQRLDGNDQVAVRQAVAVTGTTAVLQGTHIVGVTSTGATKAITLLAANSVTAGYLLEVKDESGDSTGSNKITVSRSGADLIDNTTSVTISAAYGILRLYSDGVSKWFTR